MTDDEKIQAREQLVNWCRNNLVNARGWVEKEPEGKLEGLPDLFIYKIGETFFSPDGSNYAFVLAERPTIYFLKPRLMIGGDFNSDADIKAFFMRVDAGLKVILANLGRNVRL